MGRVFIGRNQTGWVSSVKGNHESADVGKHRTDVLNLLFQESGKRVIQFRIALL